MNISKVFLSLMRCSRCGIGKLLLDYIKDKKERLQLNVYQKNARAISFYQEKGSLFNVKV